MHVAVRQAAAGQHVRDALLVVAAPDPSIPLDCKGVWDIGRLLSGCEEYGLRDFKWYAASISLQLVHRNGKSPLSSSIHLVVCGEQSKKKSRDGTPRLSSPAVLKDFSSLTLLDFLSPSDPECYFLGSLKETKGEKITLIILQQWPSYCVDL
jgi:hypothetical protein